MTTTTQKTQLQALRCLAADLGAILTIRKNSYGEYEARIRMNGSREYVMHYFGDSFEDAGQTALDVLNKIKAEQRAEGVRRQKEYKAALDVALAQAASILALVGCTVQINSDSVVTFFSPRTGSHSLNMTLGVRPVSDLLAHACGFAEQQTHVRKCPVFGCPNPTIKHTHGSNMHQMTFDPSRVYPVQ